MSQGELFQIPDLVRDGTLSATHLSTEASPTRQSSPQVQLHASADGDPRATAVWRQWLTSMASDAEAALAAAIAYRDMSSNDREKWLASLALDVLAVEVPAVALYGPLLAVEQDSERRERLLSALGEDRIDALPTVRNVALSGLCVDGTRVYVLATALYLNFAQVLACGVRGEVFTWVRHDPIVGAEGVPKAGSVFAGARLENEPFRQVIDDLALTVLSHKRTGQELPEALAVLSDLLGPFDR